MEETGELLLRYGVSTRILKELACTYLHRHAKAADLSPMKCVLHHSPRRYQNAQWCQRYIVAHCRRSKSLSHARVWTVPDEDASFAHQQSAGKRRGCVGRCGRS